MPLICNKHEYNILTICQDLYVVCMHMQVIYTNMLEYICEVFPDICMQTCASYIQKYANDHVLFRLLQTYAS